MSVIYDEDYEIKTSWKYIVYITSGSPDTKQEHLSSILAECLYHLRCFLNIYILVYSVVFYSLICNPFLLK